MPPTIPALFSIITEIIDDGFTHGTVLVRATIRIGDALSTAHGAAAYNEHHYALEAAEDRAIARARVLAGLDLPPDPPASDREVMPPAVTEPEVADCTPILALLPRGAVQPPPDEDDQDDYCGTWNAFRLVDFGYAGQTRFPSAIRPPRSAPRCTHATFPQSRSCGIFIARRWRLIPGVTPARPPLPRCPHTTRAWLGRATERLPHRARRQQRETRGVDLSSFAVPLAVAPLLPSPWRRCDCRQS